MMFFLQGNTAWRKPSELCRLRIQELVMDYRATRLLRSTALTCGCRVSDVCASAC